jgi:hypothetical protein
MNGSDKPVPGAAPGAASPTTDAESGESGDSKRRSLRALEIMLKRGLISRADYDARKKAIEAETETGRR